MKTRKLFIVLFSALIIQAGAQQNWAPVPCFRLPSNDYISNMFVDSLHNEIILFTNHTNKVCTTTYKGLFAYNGSGFRDLDFGVDTHDPNPAIGGVNVSDCITYGNKTLFGGAFYSAGTQTLYAKSLALWNGAVWDTFPTHCFSNKLNGSGGGFLGFLKHKGKLWMYGKFDSIGNSITRDLVAYDGNTFTPCPPMPIANKDRYLKAIAYKNKIIVSGLFDDYPKTRMNRLAQFDGTSWDSVGIGVQGNIGGIGSMEIYKDTLYISGNWPKGNLNVSSYLMKWDGTRLYDAGFGNFCGWGGIEKLLTYHHRLYAFGRFMCAANQKAFGVAYYENGKWTVPQDSVEGWGILNAVVYNDAIYISGGFKSINGDTNLKKFVKLLCPDFDAASGCLSGLKDNYKNQLNLKVFPNPAKDNINVEWDYAIKPEKLSLSNALGQLVLSLENPENKQGIDITELPKGIYFLKAENKQGQSVFKVMKE